MSNVVETCEPVIEPHSNITFAPPNGETENNGHYSYYKQLPENHKSPIANYYAEINWPRFEQWKLVRFATPMDGNCFFHAISNAFFSPYHTETLKGKHVSRDKMVTLLRSELSHRLAEKISDDPNASTHYEVLSGGNMCTFAEAVPEFTLENMQRELASRSFIGFGYLEFIGNALEKDIYILEAQRRDIYITDELAFTIKGNRKSIILYYINGHYELVGVHRDDNTFDTHFSPEHSLIQCLYARVQELINKQS